MCPASRTGCDEVGKMDVLLDNRISSELEALVEDYRARCLWFLDRSFFPSTTEDVLKILELIERYGDRDAYRRVERLKTWLSQHTRAQS